MAPEAQALNKNVNNSKPDTKQESGSRQISNFLPKKELALMLERINYLSSQNSYQVFNFTSSTNSEGTSSILANLSSYLLKSDIKEKIVIIDANFDNPVQHLAFNKNLSPGLGEILQQINDYSDAVQSLEDGRIYFISNGSTSHSKSFEFSDQAIPDLINKLKKDFNYILIDSSAVLKSSNSLNFARYSDVTFLITRAFKTRYEVVKKARNLLLEHQANIDGVILNGIMQPIPERLYNSL